jgi:16S rRNA (uracil1498-N3)-methyltransferase
MLMRVYLPDAAPGERTLPPTEAHHLVHVLRAPVGVAVRVFDGAGHEWDATIAAINRRAVTLAIGAEVTPVAEPRVRVTLGAALLKGDQMDAVVRDATMLGVAAIAPMTSMHVTVPDRRWQSGAALERWQRVAIASARQCGRAVVPEIREVAPWADVLRRTAGEAVLMCVEPSTQARGAAPGAFPSAGGDRAATLLVGPEGGWSSSELRDAAQAGASMIALGPRTLRAESVPAIALSALWTSWGW